MIIHQLVSFSFWRDFRYDDVQIPHFATPKVPWNAPSSGIMLEGLIEAKVGSTKYVGLRENSWVLFYLIANNLKTQIISGIAIFWGRLRNRINFPSEMTTGENSN